MVLFYFIISFFQIHRCSFKSSKKIPRVYLKCFDGVSTKQENSTCENLKAKNVTAKNCTFCTKTVIKKSKTNTSSFQNTALCYFTKIERQQHCKYIKKENCSGIWTHEKTVHSTYTEHTMLKCRWYSKPVHFRFTVISLNWSSN